MQIQREDAEKDLALNTSQYEEKKKAANDIENQVIQLQDQLNKVSSTIRHIEQASEEMKGNIQV